MTYAQAATYLIDKYPTRFIELDNETIKRWWQKHLITNLTPYSLDAAVHSNRLPKVATDKTPIETDKEEMARDTLWDMGWYDKVYSRSDRIGV